MVILLSKGISATKLCGFSYIRNRDWSQQNGSAISSASISRGNISTSMIVFNNMRWSCPEVMDVCIPNDLVFEAGLSSPSQRTTPLAKWANPHPLPSFKSWMVLNFKGHWGNQNLTGHRLHIQFVDYPLSWNVPNLNQSHSISCSHQNRIRSTHRIQSTLASAHWSHLQQFFIS